MGKVAPGKPRAQMTRTADGLEFRITAQRRAFGYFMLVFFSLFFFIFVMVLTAPAQHRPGQPPDVIAAIFPLFFMLLFFGPFIWIAMAREVVRVNSRELAYGRQLLGIGRTREFDMAEIKDLRVTPQLNPFAGWYSAYGGFMLQQGTLAFDYGYKTYRLGIGLEDAEAKYVLKEIGGLFPRVIEKSKIP